MLNLQKVNVKCKQLVMIMWDFCMSLPWFSSCCLGFEARKQHCVLSLFFMGYFNFILPRCIQNYMFSVPKVVTKIR